MLKKRMNGLVSVFGALCAVGLLAIPLSSKATGASQPRFATAATSSVAPRPPFTINHAPSHHSNSSVYPCSE